MTIPTNTQEENAGFRFDPKVFERYPRSDGYVDDKSLLDLAGEKSLTLIDRLKRLLSRANAD